MNGVTRFPGTRERQERLFRKFEASTPKAAIDLHLQLWMFAFMRKTGDLVAVELLVRNPEIDKALAVLVAKKLIAIEGSHYRVCAFGWRGQYEWMLEAVTVGPLAKKLNAVSALFDGKRKPEASPFREKP